MRKLDLLICAVVLAGCGGPQFEEDVIIVEPIVAEPAVEAKGADLCEAAGDDGIGGTGCPEAEP